MQRAVARFVAGERDDRLPPCLEHDAARRRRPVGLAESVTMLATLAATPAHHIAVGAQCTRRPVTGSYVDRIAEIADERWDR
jgi:hypothetical protein